MVLGLVLWLVLGLRESQRGLGLHTSLVIAPPYGNKIVIIGLASQVGIFGSSVRALQQELGSSGQVMLSMCNFICYFGYIEG